MRRTDSGTKDGATRGAVDGGGCAADAGESVAEMRGVAVGCADTTIGATIETTRR
jgi:hypothetical protein